MFADRPARFREDEIEVGLLLVLCAGYLIAINASTEMGLLTSVSLLIMLLAGAFQLMATFFGSANLRSILAALGLVAYGELSIVSLQWIGLPITIIALWMMFAELMICLDIPPIRGQLALIMTIWGTMMLCCPWSFRTDLFEIVRHKTIPLPLWGMVLLIVGLGVLGCTLYRSICEKEIKLYRFFTGLQFAVWGFITLSLFYSSPFTFAHATTIVLMINSSIEHLRDI